MRYVDGCELKGLFSEAWFKRNVFFGERLFARKIVLPVRFVEVKGEAAKSCAPEKNNTQRRRRTRSKTCRQHDPRRYKHEAI
jgi:hypothetical protein